MVVGFSGFCWSSWFYVVRGAAVKEEEDVESAGEDKQIAVYYIAGVMKRTTTL